MEEGLVAVFAFTGRARGRSEPKERECASLGAPGCPSGIERQRNKKVS